MMPPGAESSTLSGHVSNNLYTYSFVNLAESIFRIQKIAGEGVRESGWERRGRRV